MVLSLAGTTTVQAFPLAPGQTIPAVNEPDPIAGTVQAGTGAAVPFASGGSSGAYSGTLTSTVIAGDVTNTLGGLTFTYRLTNDTTSLSALERMTNLDFTGWQTDVSFQAPTAGVIPTTVDRDPSSSTVGWSFNPVGLGTIAPGATSALLVIQTNAPAFEMIDANILDGSTANVQSFGPAQRPNPRR